MPLVKIQGTDREIEVNLHDPIGEELPWYVAAGTEVQLGPEQFASEMANPDSEWSFSAPYLTMQPATQQAENEASARRFQSAHAKAVAKAAGRSTRGRPPAHTFSRAEDFAITVLHFEQLGYGHSTKQAKKQWEKRHWHLPSERQVEEALARVRIWKIRSFNEVVKSVYKRYRLGPVPTKRFVPKRHRGN
jgi:hypothetical protein